MVALLRHGLQSRTSSRREKWADNYTGQFDKGWKICAKLLAIW